jgi:glutaredoxin 2
MESFNYYEVAALLQIQSSDAKALFGLEKVTLKDQILKKDLEKKTGEDVDELIERRKKIEQSQAQFSLLLRDASAVKRLEFPNKFKIYERVLSPETKLRIMKSWQFHHKRTLGAKSLFAICEDKEIEILI